MGEDGHSRPKSVGIMQFIFHKLIQALLPLRLDALALFLIRLRSIFLDDSLPDSSDGPQPASR